MMKLENLSMAEIDLVDGAGQCAQDVVGAIGAAVTTIGGIVLAPVSFGASLGMAVLGGSATGIFIGLATESCSN